MQGNPHHRSKLWGQNGNFFGQIILRPDDEIPAYKAMNYSFTDDINKMKERPLTPLPVTINNDLKLLNSLKLTSKKGLKNDRLKSEKRGFLSPPNW